jgi:hypothetical protein
MNSFLLEYIFKRWNNIYLLQQVNRNNPAIIKSNLLLVRIIYDKGFEVDVWTILNRYQIRVCAEIARETGCYVA